MKDYLFNCEPASEMWSRLSVKFTIKSIANKGQLWSQFYDYKFKAEADILANITNVESLVRQLKDFEEAISEVQITNKIASISPSTFTHFRLMWDCLEESQQTMDRLTTRLKAEERRIISTRPSGLNQHEDTSEHPKEALFTTQNNQKRRNFGNNQRRKHHSQSNFDFKKGSKNLLRLSQDRISL